MRNVDVAVNPRLAIQSTPQKLTIVQKDMQIDTRPIANIASRDRRILATLNPAFEEAGLRVAHAEGIVMRHFIGQHSFTSDWDLEANLL